MADYIHGAYGIQNTAGSKVSQQSPMAFVVIGTAPVHQIAGGGSNVNIPKLVQNISEARSLFGYSDDWASYTLCEAMHVFFEQKAVGPLVLINVMNPATHKQAEAVTASLTPSGGQIVIANGENVILDTVTIGTKTKGTDYEIAYNFAKKAVVATELSAGALGSAALSVSYSVADPSAVTTTNVIGASDGEGENTGVYAVRNVYTLTGYVPSLLLAPGFSGVPAVHAAMYANSQKIAAHWDAMIYADLPLTDGATALTLSTAYSWANTNGYNKPNEKRFFPMVLGTDAKKYHLSVLAAANLLALIRENDGIPYHSSSNTAAPIIQNLYLGEDALNRVYDDEVVNQKLNKYGITSAAYVSGQWVIWGAHTADYNPDSADEINVAETNIMMLYWLTNDFQRRRSPLVDRPMTQNDLESVVAEEQARLDALVKIGALTFGEAQLSATAISESDVFSGDYQIVFNVTTTPLAKSITAIVNWVKTGLEIYFAGSDQIA
jgi:hypothetical protein